MKVVVIISIKMNFQKLPHRNILPVVEHPLCRYFCNSFVKTKDIDEVTD